MIGFTLLGPRCYICHRHIWTLTLIKEHVDGRTRKAHWDCWRTTR